MSCKTENNTLQATPIIPLYARKMKHLHFDVETGGFYGAYWACADGPGCAVIAMIGDDPEDRLARPAAKWLCGYGVNVLTMSPGRMGYGHHHYPLERIEAAISWLKAHGTHFVFPEGMLKSMLPVGSALFVKWAFPAAGKYPKECRETRKGIKKRMGPVLAEWKGEQ